VDIYTGAYTRMVTNHEKTIILNPTLVKKTWEKYAESKGFEFETRDRRMPLAGEKTEVIIRKKDSIKIRGVFQLDINGWGQGQGTLNKTTVTFEAKEEFDFVDDKVNRKKFQYKKCNKDNLTLTIEYPFMFETISSFALMEEMLVMNKIRV